MSQNNFDNNKNINTTPSKEGLLVIGAGYGRTGTASMQQALNQLGFGPCYHMREVFRDSHGVHKWDQVGLNKDNADWDDIFRGYHSTVDFPAAPYYLELLQKYPNAKVILTVRNPEKWWKSYSETIGPTGPLWRLVYTLTGMRNSTNVRMIENCVYRHIAGGWNQARDKQAALAGFAAHNARVQATVPSDQLLVYEVQQGWEPLCKFLEVPVPKDVPFPRTNDTVQFQKMVIQRKKKALLILSVEVAFVVAGGWLWMRRGKTT